MKIYISKSSYADLTLYNRLKFELKKYNVTIIEHSGGTYNHATLKKADLILYVPPEDSLKDTYFAIGRGQYDQMIATPSVPSYLVGPDFHLYVYSVPYKIGDNWANSYAKCLITKNCNYTLKDILSAHLSKSDLTTLDTNFEKNPCKEMISSGNEIIVSFNEPWSGSLAEVPTIKRLLRAAFYMKILR